VVERRNCYSFHPSSNPTCDMFSLYERIVDGGWRGTSNLTPAYRLEGGTNCFPRNFLIKIKMPRPFIIQLFIYIYRFIFYFNLELLQKYLGFIHFNGNRAQLEKY
jgi:hypothetical protein